MCILIAMKITSRMTNRHRDCYLIVMWKLLLLLLWLLLLAQWADDFVAYATVDGNIHYVSETEEQQKKKAMIGNVERNEDDRS